MYIIYENFREAVLGILCLVITTVALGRFWTLRRFPGPSWAKFTDIQRLFWVRSGRSHEIHMALHSKYGSCVRFGPNMVSLSDPNLIPEVYPIRSGLSKSNFYRSMMPYVKSGNALPLVFNVRDDALHKKLKTPIASHYSLSNVLTFEATIDQVLQILFDQLDRRFCGDSAGFDLGEWVQFFAFDAMGTMSFSRRYGFLETGCDCHGLLAGLWKFFTCCAPVTQMPWFDYVWQKNPVVAIFRPTSAAQIMKVVREKIEERYKEIEASSSTEKGTINEKDFLSRFMAVQSERPQVPKWAVVAWTTSNIIAGSDTFALVAKSLLYHVLLNEKSYASLSQELLQAMDDSNLSYPFPKWCEIADLPYLSACTQEALRLFPALSLPLERVVPKGGMTIDGRVYPQGTTIGMNPYVVNRHKPTFGEDADEWRPERWLVDSERTQYMKERMLSFGAGKRSCLGKHIAVVEIKKLTAALMLNYEITLLDPSQYNLENRFLFRQEGLITTIKRRQVGAKFGVP